jgi:chromate reductase, NAD(P)H dehydrogenase (quinone)
VPPVCHVLLVSGSLRRESTNSAVLRTARRCVPDGVEATLYGGMAALPAFNPDDDGESLAPEVADLRDAIRRADALLFSTPEYAGDLPGSFKNLLDWSVGDPRPGSIYAKPVAWVNVAVRGATHAHESLRRVLGYVGADLIAPACLDIAVASDMVGYDRLVADETVRQQLTRALALLAGARAYEISPGWFEGNRVVPEGFSGAPRPGGPRR